MVGTIVASGSIPFKLQGTYFVSIGANHITNPDVAKMKATDLVFVSASAGNTGSAPGDAGPIFHAAVTRKSAGSFSCIVSTIDSSIWFLATDFNLDYVIVNPG